MNLSSITSTLYRIQCRPSLEIAGSAARRFGFLAVAVILFAAATPALRAQAPAESAARDRFGRFSFGGRIGFFANDPMNDETLTIAGSDPAFRIQRLTTSTASRLSGGATMEVAVADRVSVSIDFLYRKVGYNEISNIVQGIDDPDTTKVDERVLTTAFESTHANYWDVPVLLRFYHLGRHDTRPRAFVDVGAVLRHVANVQTYRRRENPDESIDIDETPASPARKQVPGVVVGGGFQFRGVSGIKVMPEVRYTRWLTTTFDAPPTWSTRNQVEVLLGITF